MDYLPDVGINPDYGLQQGGSFRVQKVSLGDGYEQSRPDGINTVRRSWSVEWGLLDRAQRDTLYDFLVARKGVYAFLWEVPTEGVTFKVKCPKMPNWSHDAYGTFSLKASFVEDFTP